MDELDIRILRELTQGGHEGLAWGEIDPSYRALSRKLGASVGTVRDRVVKMSSSGFLKVFPIQVNPALLGLYMGSLAVDVPHTSPKKELLEKLVLIDGMLIVATHVGTLIGLIFYYEDEKELERKIKLVEKVCGATGMKFTKIPYPRCSIKLSKRDWEVIRALQAVSPRSARFLSKRLGISARTLKRRTKRLIDGMAVSTILSIEAHALNTGVIGNILVTYNRKDVRADADRELLRALDSRLLFVGLWTDFSLFTAVLPSIHAASETLETVKNVGGVASARLDLMHDRVEVYSTLSEAVERKLKSVQTAEPSAHK